MLDKKALGFTLVEVLITVLIFSLLIGAMLTILITGSTSWQIGNVRIELQQELRKGMVWITQELRQSGSSVISGVPANGTAYPTIGFRIPNDTDGDGDVIDASGDIEWGNQIVYLLNGEQLLRQVGTEQRVLANSIVALQFRRQSSTSEIVEVALETEKQTPRGQLLEVDLDFQIRLRN